MVDEEKVKIYDIPDNFIDESRIFNGIFKTRNFVEGVVMALIAAIPALLIPASTLNTRIVILIAICGPFFLLGNAGYNGDPISTTILHAKAWYQGRGIMLYNANSRALKESPLAYMESTELPRDKLVDMVNNWKNARRQRNERMVYIEGETFEFIDDMDLAHLYMDVREPEALNTMLVTPQEQGGNYRRLVKESCTAVLETVGLDAVQGENSSAVGGDAVHEEQRTLNGDDADVLTIEIPAGE